jgi:DNA-binding PadR family transcriptional regulator
MRDKDIFGGLVRLHVLYHASHEDVFGLGLIEELARHGYKTSPGTLYPLLHGLEKNGYLQSRVEQVGKRNRRVYTITADGRAALKVAKTRVWELFREFFEEELEFGAKGAGRKRGSLAGTGRQGTTGHD